MSKISSRGRVEIGRLDPPDAVAVAQCQGDVILDVAFALQGCEGGRVEPRPHRRGEALEEVDEVHAEIDERAAAGLLAVEHPRTPGFVIARGQPGDELEIGVEHALAGRFPAQRRHEARGPEHERDGGEDARRGRRAGERLHLRGVEARRLLDDERDLPLDQDASRRGHVRVPAEDEREIGPDLLAEFVRAGRDRASEALAEAPRHRFVAIARFRPP